MESPEDSLTEVLGQVTVPSGMVFIVDTGLLNFWCHDREPVMPAGAASDETVESANNGTDFRIEGQHAEEAGRAFDRQWNPRFLFDIPSHGIDKIHQSFADCLDELHLDARLVPLERRVPHRVRVDEAIAYGDGAGEVMFQGISAIVVAGVPTDRPLSVRGTRMPPDGPDQGRWRSVWLECAPGADIRESQLVSYVVADKARLMFADVEALGHWEHERPLDGCADCVFWGRDAEQVAQKIGAPDLGDEHWGWINLPADEVVERAIRVQELQEEHGYKLALDFRPHSHHFLVMQQVRSSPTDSGTVEVGGAQVCTFMTSWGDAYFPVYLDLDADRHLVRIRIDLGNDQIVARQRKFEKQYPPA
jgi:hypothetical protein